MACSCGTCPQCEHRAWIEATAAEVVTGMATPLPPADLPEFTAEERKALLDLARRVDAGEIDP